MSSTNSVKELRDALKLANSTEATEKLTGLQGVDHLLKQDISQLVELGYDKVLLKELLKFVKFEEGNCLRATLDLIDNYYSNKSEHQDEIMESLLYRYGLSTDDGVSLQCLRKISKLVDHMSENVAKHSRQILQLADITLSENLSLEVSQILEKIKVKLPRRRTFD